MAAVSPAGPPPTIRQSRICSSMRGPMDCDSGGSAMTFRASVLTLYPDIFPGPLGASLAGKALQDGIWSLEAKNIRDFATDKHRSVDDTPAGGGAGMVLRPDVLAAALDSVADGRPLLALTPRGALLTQSRVRELATGEGVILLCGRFEGFDERIFEARRLEPVSVGDYVLSGGEVGAMVILDACVRLLPGVKVIEGDRTRVQNFEGVCIARANKGVGSSFTVRKISFGEGVERVFPLYSPIIDHIEVVRRGDVRRAKLYYLRGRTGKAARIAERRTIQRDIPGGQGAETEAAPAETTTEA